MSAIIDRGAALFNEKDFNHASDSAYRKYRDQASQFYAKKNNLAQQSQAAFKSGDKQRAHELSEQSKQALQQAENCNKQAAQYVFTENNADSKGDEIDLHGLYVKEAKWILQKRIAECMRSHQSHLKVIVGKGLHSANGVARLKPAMDEMCDESGLTHYIDKHNSGVMVIQFGNATVDNLPSHWDTSPIGSGVTSPSYQPHQQPQYQNHQNQNQNHNNNHNNNNNQNSGYSSLVKLLLKVVCNCLK